jgi:hypothetical protein
LGRIWDFRLNSRLDRKSNQKFSVEIPVETENWTGDFRFEPDMGPRTNRASPKTCLGLAELVRLKPEIPGWISGGIFGQTENSTENQKFFPNLLFSKRTKNTLWSGKGDKWGKVFG